MNTMKREMKQISPELMKVACDIECLIGTNCVNHKYDRENYRYPVQIPNPHIKICIRPSHNIINLILTKFLLALFFKL